MDSHNDEKMSASNDQQTTKDDYAYESVEIDNSDLENLNRSLLWKIDIRLMPLMYGIPQPSHINILTLHRCITYALQSIDKTTLGYAAVFGVREEANLTGPEYSWLGSLFYLGYLAWEFPTGMLLQRFPIAKFMSITVILWGIVLMCHAAADDFAGLATARTFLGERSLERCWMAEADRSRCIRGIDQSRYYALVHDVVYTNGATIANGDMDWERWTWLCKYYHYAGTRVF